jgi:hypothetical protein
MYFDDLIGRCGNINLKKPSLVERTVKKSQQTLMGNIGSIVSWIFPQLVHDIVGVVVTVKEDIFMLLEYSNFEGSLLEHNDHFAFILHIVCYQMHFLSFLLHIIISLNNAYLAKSRRKRRRSLLHEQLYEV